jgi:hypothetical protein
VTDLFASFLNFTSNAPLNLLPSVKAHSCPLFTSLETDGGVAQVMECLPSKHEAVSSNPSTTKEKKES